MLAVGYCLIPYDYMTNRELCFDTFAIRKLANEALGRQNWDFNDNVDYLDVDRNRSSDDTNDNNYEIRVFDESDDDNDINQIS